MRTPLSSVRNAAETRPAGLGAGDEEALCRLITARTGIMFHGHQMNGLRDTVTDACMRFGHHSGADFLQALQKQPDMSPELEFLVARITVGESYFFRDSAQMSLLQDSLLPEIIARKRMAGDHSLRIWSAGCSTGQEIYSLTILLHELLPDINDWMLHLLATDINTDVLASAIRGHYREWSFRATHAAIVKKYFAPVDSEYLLDKAIRRHVKFGYLNLSEDAFPSLLTETHALDLILCRNVFIYIEPSAARNIMNRFAECLVPDGLLLLGPSDHVDWSTRVFHRIQTGDASYFRKLSGQAEAAKHEPYMIESVAAGQTAGITDTAVADALKMLTAGARGAQKPRAGADPGIAERVSDLLRAGRWHDALIAIEQASGKFGTSADLLQAKAKALASLGNLGTALQACEQSLALDPADKHTYLIQGIVLMEHGQPQQAEAALRKAIYLDHTFPEAHHQLGLLLLRLGRRESGLKSLGNALTLAEQGDPQREIHNASGMSYMRFAEILRNELSIYASTPPVRRRQQGLHPGQRKGAAL